MHRLLTLALLFTTATAATGAQELQRELPPPPAPLRPFNVPAIEEARLPNGFRIVVAERRTLPLVHGRIIVNAGGVHEPAEKSGLAVLTGTLLVEGGAGTMSSAELAQRMAALGAPIASGGSLSWSAVNFTSLTSVFPEALALAATTVRSPAFDERDVARVRAQAVAAYERSMGTAEGIANRLFTQALFDESAPYSRSPQGTAATLSRLTREEISAWHASMYGPANTTLLLVGDVTLAQARGLATELFGDWAAPARSLPTPPNPLRSSSTGRVILVDRPGSVQSAIRVGVPGVATPDPEFFRMTVLDRLMGGGFTSRINTNLRERRGFTYGAQTSLWALHNAGVFYASSSVRSDATDSALVEVMHEFRRIAEEPVPAEEFEAAQNNLVASFPASVQALQELAGQLQTLLIYSMPLDYYNSYRERLAAVTPEEISAAARQRLRPDAVTMVVVGDLSRIEDPIRARGFGEVEVWNEEGARVR